MNQQTIKYCPDCGIYLPVEKFYTIKNKFSSYCKKHSNQRVQKQREKNQFDFEFVNHVPPKPNTYFDENQKEQVFKFMNKLGWLFNEEKQIWFKDGIKDSNGNWLIKSKRSIN
jgi:hypothetical protein